MALDVPNLDDRRFQDFVDDAKRLVQRQCPEWTDHNVSDPGVTLIETFAHMTDHLAYRLNLVPDRLYLKFLDLIGLTLLPPTAATTTVTFWLTAPATSSLTISTGTRVATLRAYDQEAIEFATVDELVLPRRAVHAVRTTAGATDADERTANRTVLLAHDRSFPAFSDPPVVDESLLIGLDDPAPRCAIRIDLRAHVDGIGVDPTNPPLVWEAWTGSTWTACETSSDSTGGLNTSGSVIVHVPVEHEASVVDGVRAGWLRARIRATDAGQGAYRHPPVIHGLTACTVGGTVTAMHGELIEREILGEAEGVPGQTFTLSRYPVMNGMAKPALETSTEDGWQEWTAVDHFAESTEHDRHYLLDPVSGTVAFGPAVRDPDGSLRRCGAIPEHGATVRIRRYSVGGGRQGNVTAGAITTLRSSIPFVATVENRRAARGGVDGETIDEAKSRAPLLIRTRSRAVTADDYEVLARQAAPDATRIRCIAAGDGDAAAGQVRLLVVPAVPNGHGRVAFEDLLPQPESMQRIATHLDKHRVIGTSVSVEPPRYRGVTVVAKLVADRAADAERVRARAEAALYEFISPLPGGGPDGGGWPFGRAAQLGDIYGLLQKVPGVQNVSSIRLFPADPVTGRRGPESTRIELDSHSLVFSFDHQVLVEAG